MFYDLNVPYGADDPDISHTLNFLAERTSLGLLCWPGCLFYPGPHEKLT